MTAGRHRWRARGAAYALAAACAGIAVGLAGCQGNGAPRQAGVPGTVAPSRPATPTAAPTASASATVASAAQACVTQAYDRLSLAQRVGQLFLVGVDGDIAGPELRAAESTYHFGSLLLTKSGIGTKSLAARTAAMQALAPAATGGTRLFIAANQEGGAVQQLTGPGFSVIPPAVVQGGDATATLRQAAAAWGAQLRRAGVNLDLAPVMDVVPAGTAARNAPIGALGRQLGADPDVTGPHGAAFIEGMASAGVATVAKHFPGLGRVAGNTDDVPDVTDTVTTAGDPALGSFRAAVTAGVPFVMVALATYTRIDASRLAVFSPAVMRLLRAGPDGGLGFQGVIVSDDLGDAAAVQAIAPGTRAVDFLDAGGDLITAQSLPPAQQMARAVLERAQASAAFRATVDAAARRVLTAKQASGLLPC